MLKVAASLRPMIPARAPRPFHRPGWVYEEKIDGYRMLAVKEGSRVRLLSRRGYEMGERFPGIVAALSALPASFLISSTWKELGERPDARDAPSGHDRVSTDSLASRQRAKATTMETRATPLGRDSAGAKPSRRKQLALVASLGLLGLAVLAAILAAS